VCRKVEEKGRTTYNQVADELVAEFSAGIDSDQPHQAYDEKNIRRRVYDALNVLMAMDIIAKERKDIRWKGFPANAEKEYEMLQDKIDARANSIRQKQDRLEELVMQYISLKNLLRRNESKEYCQTTKHRIYIPYVIVKSHPETSIQIDITEDRQTVEMTLDRTFALQDDVQILNEMGMYRCPAADLEKLVPPALIPFITQRRPEVVCQVSDNGLDAYGVSALESSAGAAAAAGTLPV